MMTKGSDNPSEAAEERTCPACGHRYLTALADGLGQGCPKCVARFLREDTLFSEAGDSMLNPGDMLGGMEILGVLGRGGMGAVYRARQVKLDRIVALKVLDAKLAASEEFTSRFNREAKALATLNHPNIVQVFDYGQENGHCYLVMELVDGTSLREILTSGSITPEAALRYVPQLCNALEYAHGKGVIHRDVKPENILLDREGHLKMADFGLAKMAEREGSDPSLVTQAGRLMGTPHYMAPEQRKHTGSVDHRADIYSLGVVFYEMLTGELPLGRYPMPSERAHVHVSLDEVVLKALEQNPDLRYQHASEVKDEVDANAGRATEVSGPDQKSAAPSVSVMRPGAGTWPLVLIGAFCLPWGFPVLWEIHRGFDTLARGFPTGFHASEIYRYFLMPFGIFLALTATLLGWVALDRIGKAGRSVGQYRLALLDALCYPALTLGTLVLLVLPKWLMARDFGVPAVGGLALAAIVLAAWTGTLLLWKRVRAFLSKPRRFPRYLAVAALVVTAAAGWASMSLSAENRRAERAFYTAQELMHSSEMRTATLEPRPLHPAAALDPDLILTPVIELCNNIFGKPHLRRLAKRHEDIFAYLRCGDPTGHEEKIGTFCALVAPNRHKISLAFLTKNSSYITPLPGWPDMYIHRLAIKDEVLHVNYEFPAGCDPDLPENIFEDQVEAKKRKNWIRERYGLEADTEYELQIPISEAMAEGVELIDVWETGKPRVKPDPAAQPSKTR